MLTVILHCCLCETTKSSYLNRFLFALLPGSSGKYYLFGNVGSIFSVIIDIVKFSSSFFGGGPMEEEEKTVKGDDVVVELDATLEDLYMGGSLKVRTHLLNI